MTTAQLDNSNVSKLLGKTVDYPDQYDSSILVREPRQGNRQHLNLDDDDLPFCGYDIWNAYEISCLTRKGFPVTGIAKIVYPCDNSYIVESKSLKLYLNSFNMTKIGETAAGARSTMEQHVHEDLSDLLETDVHVTILDPTVVSDANGDRYFKKDYVTLEHLSEADSWFFTEYSEDPTILTGGQFISNSDYLVAQKYHSSLLKSNCRVTSQPDWGDVYIAMKSRKVVKPEHLLKYIVSFRDENHFHEEVVETIYTRLWNMFKPTQLAVTSFYTRRGGIDINPTRVSSVDLLSHNLIECEVPFAKASRQ